MPIKETPVFTRQIKALMSEDTYRRLQEALVKNPSAGVEIAGTGGLRKLRWKATGRGKRGGTRIIYFWIRREDQIYMLLAYGKNEQDDLTPTQVKAVRQLVAEELNDER